MEKEYGKLHSKMKIKKFKRHNKSRKRKNKPDKIVEFEEKGGNRRAHRVERCQRQNKEDDLHE